MKYKTVLITGGAGFIGTHVANFFAQSGWEAKVLDNLHPQIHADEKIPDTLNSKCTFIKGDVTNRKIWQEALEGIEVVIHLAAAVGVGQSMYQIERYVKDNCLGTAIFLDILANEKHTVKKMLVASSMTTFGEGMYRCPKCGLIQQGSARLKTDIEKNLWEPLCRSCQTQLVAIPTDELTRQNSPSVYAITKKAQEELVISIGKTYQIPAVALRFFNAFGPGQSLSNPYCGVAAIFLSRVKNGQSPIINEDGLQTRDFIYISDIVNAIALAIDKDTANYEIFNVGSSKPTTVKAVAEVALKLYGSSLKPDITRKFRTFDIRHCFADTTKLRRLLGWKPQVTFEDGMKKVYDWSRDEEAVDHVSQANSELVKRGLL